MNRQNYYADNNGENTMSNDEISEIRKDIQKLAIQVALLTQKVDNLAIPKQPCKDFEEHIDRYHQEELSKIIKAKAVGTLISTTILAILGYLYLGFLTDLKIKEKELETSTKTHQEK